MTELIAGLLLAASLQAAPDSLTGRYSLDREAGDDPAEVAEVATRDLRRMVRGRMRPALEEALTPSETLDIRWDGEGYIVSGGDGRSLRVVPDEGEQEMETPQGESARIAAKLTDESLEIRMRTPTAERIQTLTPTELGLHVVNTLILDRLSEPVRMELVYRRVGVGGQESGADRAAGREGQGSTEVDR